MKEKDHDSLSPFQVNLLKRHNFYRQKHHVSPLFWNSYLAQKAHELCQQYQDSINENEDKKEVIYVFNSLISIPDIGQNIHITTKFDQIQGYEIVDDWYSSCTQYNYNAAKGNTSTDTFTQVVWKSTVHIGVQTMIFHNKQITIALYSPKGNIVGEYIRNVLDPMSYHGEPIRRNSTYNREPRPISAVYYREPIPNGPTYNPNDYNTRETHRRIDIRLNLIKEINKYRHYHGLEQLEVARELEVRSQKIAQLLLNLWMKLDHSPDITIKTVANYGISIAFVPRGALKVDWIVDHWTNVNKIKKGKPSLEDENSGETESIFLSPMIKLAGVGIASKSVACIVCLFAPAKIYPKDVSLTYYKHTKCTTHYDDTSCDMHGHH